MIIALSEAKMTTRERIIVALVAVVTIALGGIVMLHVSGASSEGHAPAAPTPVAEP
jgi:hypothetical protein